jgi:hypothetical protein
MNLGKSVCVMIIILLLFASAGCVKFFGKDESKDQKITPKNGVKIIEQKRGKRHEMDLAFIKDRKGKHPRKIASALVRLAYRKDPKALEVAKEYQSSKEDILRQAAYEAMAMMGDGDTLKELFKLIKSEKKPLLRVKALTALGLGRNDDKLKFMRNIFQRGGWLRERTDEERLEFYSSYHRIENNKTRRKQAVEMALAIVQSSKESRYKAILKLQGMAPHEPKVINLVKEDLKKGNGDPVYQGRVIRFLSMVEPTSIKGMVKNLVVHPAVAVRVAAVQTLHRTCPKGRWNIIESILKKEQEKAVLQALLGVIFALGEPAQADKMVKLIEGDDKFDSSLKIRAKTSMERLKKRKFKHPACVR